MSGSSLRQKGMPKDEDDRCLGVVHPYRVSGFQKRMHDRAPLGQETWKYNVTMSTSSHLRTEHKLAFETADTESLDVSVKLGLWGFFMWQMALQRFSVQQTKTQKFLEEIGKQALMVLAQE